MRELRIRESAKIVVGAMPASIVLDGNRGQGRIVGQIAGRLHFLHTISKSCKLEGLILNRVVKESCNDRY